VTHLFIAQKELSFRVADDQLGAVTGHAFIDFNLRKSTLDMPQNRVAEANFCPKIRGQLGTGLFRFSSLKRHFRQIQNKREYEK
jgi:hypothetical protein